MLESTRGGESRLQVPVEAAGPHCLDQTGGPEGEDGGRAGARGEDKATEGPPSAAWKRGLSCPASCCGFPPRTWPEGRAQAARVGV